MESNQLMRFCRPPSSRLIMYPNWLRRWDSNPRIPAYETGETATSRPLIIFRWRKVWDSNPRGTLLTPLPVFKTGVISQTLPTFHSGGKYRSRTCSPFPMPLISNQADYRSRNLPYGDTTGNRTHDLKDENLLS